MDESGTHEYSDELNEGRRRIRGGCTIGRIINLCMALDFLLVVVTALIVSGTLGGVNLTLQRSYKDHDSDPTPINHEVCILYSTCDSPEPTAACDFHYNQSGVCKYVEVAFGFVALIALVYIVVSIVRAVLTTTISFTVFVDLAMILVSMLVAFTTGVIVSIGLKLTCDSVNSRYTGSGIIATCDRLVPYLRPDVDPPTPDTGDGYSFYNSVNISQSCSWLCFAFLSVLFIMTIVRIVIFIKRRRVSREENIDDITDVLSREHSDDEEEDAKPI